MKIGFIILKNIILGEDFLNLWTSEKEKNAYQRLYTTPNLGILTVAGLTDKSWDMEVQDENVKPLDYSSHYDIVCLSPVAQQINAAYAAAKRFKENGSTIVFGGLHATVRPEEVKKHSDSVIIGEAEGLWEEFLKDYKHNAIKPFYKRKENEFVDLTTSPLPRYDLLPVKEHYKYISIQVTRGCPRNCEFCASGVLYGSRYRHKTVEQVVNEVRTVKEIWKRPFFYFTDDNMFIKRKFSKKLLKALIPLKIRWYTFSDISISQDEELLELLAKSGCIQITFGFESVNAESLKQVDLWKYRQLQHYPEAIKKIQSYGIGVLGSFVVGLDHDDTSVFENIYHFVIENNLFGSSITIQTPFPGTRLHDRLMKENRIIDTNYDHYTCFDVIYKPRKMSAGELKEGFIWLYQALYSEEITKKRLRYFTNLLTQRNKTLVNV